MRFVLFGLAMGLIWAVMQYGKGEVTDPAALAGPVLLFALFGLVLWGVRVLVVRLKQGKDGGTR